MALSNKIAINQMAEICALKGMEHIVFSPGSRNAPMVLAFNAQKNIKCHCLVDERSAAFFALGLAQVTQKPVAIVCTSGTASLNYAPAIAEALYQKIPLLVLTADRPVEWIDQADMQSIRQQNVFANFIKKSFQLPQHQTETDLWFAQRIVNEAFNQCLFPEVAPVHINIPLTEPLYENEIHSEKEVKIINTSQVQHHLDKSFEKDLKAIWEKTPKKLFVSGLLNKNTQTESLINKVSQNSSAVFLTEPTSNIIGKNLFKSIDRIVDTLSQEQETFLQPDLLITFGGMVVSKKIKTFLRKHKPKFHWHISPTYQHFDTYQSLTHLIPLSVEDFFEMVINWENPTSNYFEEINKWDEIRIEKQHQYLQQIPFSDFKAYDVLWSEIPKNSILQMGNSTPIRYACLFGLDESKNLQCFSNRGVGGIDGTLSTAAGYASASKKTVTFITGDLAFFYDSNGLWNPNFPKNLRIILINNDGGNIFRIIPGPDTTPHLEQFFEHKHTLNAQPLCQMFKIDYLCAQNEAELTLALQNFYNQSSTAKLLEIKTDGALSAQILRDYFNFLKD